VSLAQSTATPASDGTSVYYTERQLSVSIVTGDSQCFAWLNSSTKSKASTTYVSMTLGGVAVAPTCTTGWLESSTDNGKTWQQATPTYSLNILSGIEYAFSPAVADGTGYLVRACVKGNAAKKCGAAQTTAFTSPARVTFRPGRRVSFTIRTSGYPAAGLTASGRLPARLRLKINRNGTAVISGKVARSTRHHRYRLTITASSGSQAVTQVLIITVS
jgi:hypothetical protein